MSDAFWQHSAETARAQDISDMLALSDQMITLAAEREADGYDPVIEVTAFDSQHRAFIAAAAAAQERRNERAAADPEPSGSPRRRSGHPEDPAPDPEPDPLMAPGGPYTARITGARGGTTIIRGGDRRLPARLILLGSGLVLLALSGHVLPLQAAGGAAMILAGIALIVIAALGGRP